MPTVSTYLAWYSWYSRPSVYHRLFELTRITYSPTAFQLWYKYKLYLILLNSYQVPLFGWWLIKLLEDRVRSVPIPVNGASMEKPGAGRLIRCVRRPGAWPTSSRQITVLCNLLFNCDQSFPTVSWPFVVLPSDRQNPIVMKRSLSASLNNNTIILPKFKRSEYY